MTEALDRQQKELLEAAKKMQIAMVPMIANIDAISQSMQPTLRALESIQSNLLPTLKIIEAWQKSFIPLFNRIDFVKLTAKAKEMRTPAFRKFMKEWGWFVNNRSISFGDYCYGLYKKYGNKGFEDKVSRWFYHKENLNTVLNDIKSKFPERYLILKEGFEYHGKRNYACSITLLLPHAEGILWELGIKRKLVKRGYSSTKKYKKYVTSKKQDWELAELSKELFPKDKFHKIIVSEIFCDGPRNKILHGRNFRRRKQKEISRWRSTLLILTLWRLSDEF